MWPRSFSICRKTSSVIIFRVLPAALAADVFEYLDVEAQQQLLRCMAHEQVVAILNEMSPDDRTALLEEMPSAAARQLIQLLTPEERRVAQALLGYPEGSVGPFDDTGLYRGARGLDGEGGARLRARARSGQRDAQRHLRGRRTREADRRPAHSRVSAQTADGKGQRDPGSRPSSR